MYRILDIATKDLQQLLRDLKTFLFFLLMPVIFTLMFGLVLGGGGSTADDRLPVGILDLDRGSLSIQLVNALSASPVVRVTENDAHALADLEKQVAQGKLAAAVVIPSGYSAAGTSKQLELVVKDTSQQAETVRSAVLAAASRLESASRAASIVAAASGSPQAYEATLAETLAAWEQPPARLAVFTSREPVDEAAANPMGSTAQTSPGMMLQFAIAGLLVAANILVAERKSGSFRRLLTTATAPTHILLGHYLAIFALIFVQFCLLVAFGQIILKVDYLRAPAATLLVMLASALCIAALGLLIGVLSKSDEQAITFSLIPMFLFAGLGGAWVPLEVTGKTFQVIGHASPIAWAMDGFKNITLRGLGLESVLLPSLALLGYAVLFFGLAAWRLKTADA